MSTATPATPVTPATGRRRARRDGAARAARPARSAPSAQDQAIGENLAARREAKRKARGMPGVRRARSVHGVVDLAVVAVLAVLAVLGLGPAFGSSRYLVTAVGALVIGLALAWFGATKRVGVLGMTALTMLAYVLLGGVLALPARAIGGVVPTLATLRGLLLGSVTSWKDFVTAAPPLAAFPDLLVVPFLTVLVLSVIAASIALRSRRSQLALLPLGVLLVAVILFGTTQTVLPVVQGLGFALVGLTWSAWRAGQRRSELVAATATSRRAVSAGSETGVASSRARLRTRRLRGGAAMLVGAGVLTALIAPSVAPAGPRVVLRDVVVPPLELHDFASPLVGFRSYVKDHADEVLFTVSGLPAGERVRLATMDAYAGTVIDVAGGSASDGSGSFSRAGTSLPASPLAPTGKAKATTVKFVINTYDDVWVPSIGQPESIDFTGERASALSRGLHYNPVGAMALSTAGLAKGDTYTEKTVLRPTPSGSVLEKAAFAGLRLPLPQSVPDAVALVADSFAGDASSPLEKVENLRDGLASSGVLSNGLEGEPISRAGHGADRIATLLAGKQMVGDDEQFAVAMTLMARQLGIPARVVMGFYPQAVAETPAAAAPGAAKPVVPAAKAAAPSRYDVHGSDVHAWVEVAFAGVGWVPFDPLPDENTPPKEQDTRSQSAPQPQQLLQPPPPKEPQEPPAQAFPEDADKDQIVTKEQSWFRFVVIGLAILLPLLVLLSPFVVVGAVKARRRARRRRLGPGATRLAGGWREVLDTARDLGHSADPVATRRETSRALALEYPHAGAVALAQRTDAGVFGPGDPSELEVDGFWLDVEQVTGQMVATVSPLRRLRARYSLRSLRRTRAARPGSGSMAARDKPREEGTP